jgi:hypothetical protein
MLMYILRSSHHRATECPKPDTLVLTAAYLHELITVRLQVRLYRLICRFAERPKRTYGQTRWHLHRLAPAKPSAKRACVIQRLLQLPALRAGRARTVDHLALLLPFCHDPEVGRFEPEKGVTGVRPDSRHKATTETSVSWGFQRSWRGRV